MKKKNNYLFVDIANGIYEGFNRDNEFVHSMNFCLDNVVYQLSRIADSLEKIEECLKEKK